MVTLDGRQVFSLEKLTSIGATFYVKVYCICWFWHPFDFLRNSSWLLKLLIGFLDSKVYHNLFFISSSLCFFSCLSSMLYMYVIDVLAVLVTPAENSMVNIYMMCYFHRLLWSIELRKCLNLERSCYWIIAVPWKKWEIRREKLRYMSFKNIPVKSINSSSPFLD